jgi:hypothetical protein
MITAYTTELLEQLMWQWDIDYYLTKPFQLGDMERLVARALGAHAATTQAAAAGKRE